MAYAMPPGCAVSAVFALIILAEMRRLHILVFRTGVLRHLDLVQIALFTANIMNALGHITNNTFVFHINQPSFVLIVWSFPLPLYIHPQKSG